MEKIVKIGSKDVRFKATGGVMYRYKAQFGREYLTDVIEMEKCRTVDNEGKTSYELAKFSLETLYNIAWVYAKTADETIPPPQEWLDSFEEFPVFRIWDELSELMSANATVDRKNVQTAAVAEE